MSSFKAGPHEWKLRLTVGMFGAIEREIEVDLGRLYTDEDQFGKLLLAPPRNLVKALWIMCEPQAAGASITFEAFECLFGVEEIDAARAALFDTAVDFFPNASGRNEIRKMLPLAMEKIDQRTEKEFASRLSTLLSTAGNSPESSASIPPG